MAKVQRMTSLFKLTYVKKLFLKKIWGDLDSSVSPRGALLISSLRITHLIIRDLMGGMLNLRAMSLVFTTILALVPLLAVSFSVLKGFGVHNQLEPLLLNLLLPLGDKGLEITTKIISFVDNTKTGVLGSLGLALLLYTVISLLQKIEHSFNYTWHVSELRSIGKRYRDYFTVVMVCPVLLFTAIGVSASIANIAIIQDVMQIESIGFFTKLIGYLLPYILVVIAFTFAYMFIPNTLVKFKSALIGAIVSGVLWETSSGAFALFITGSAQYTAIYSAFASMIIFFLWLYITWLILLIGCSVAFYHQNPSQQRLASREVNLSNQEKEIIALNVMALIASHYQKQKDAWTIHQLAEKMGISIEICFKIVLQLISNNLLKKTVEIPATYIPCYNLETISLHDIVSSIRSSEKNNFLNIKVTENVKKTQQEIESAIKKILEQKSLKDL